MADEGSDTLWEGFQKLQETLNGLACGDSSCCIARRGGMSTNGGCRCFQRGTSCRDCREYSQRAQRAIQLLRRQVRMLKDALELREKEVVK